jgi:hypothetical protein
LLAGCFLDDDAYTYSKHCVMELAYSGTVRITALGPDGVWFGIGFGAPSYAMVDLPYAVVVEGTGAISER